MENKIENLVKEAMSKIKTIIDTNTVVGETISINESVQILPVSKVTAGFVAGGGDIVPTKSLKKNCISEYPFTGGSANGFSIQPIGFIVVENSITRFIKIDNNTSFDNLLIIAKDLTSKYVKKE